MSGKAGQQDYSGQLASYASGLSFSEIPSDVVQHVKSMFLNLTAATLWGLKTKGGKQVLAVMSDLGGLGEATVFGTRHRLPPVSAASIHAGLAFTTMTDDTHGPAQIHSGHATVPVAFSEGEATGASGQDVIAAIVAANEVGIRIAHSVGPEQDQQYNTMRMGFWAELKASFCALVASGRLLGLDAEQMRHGLGIAATSSSGVLAIGYALPCDSTHCGTVFTWDAAKAVLMGGLSARLARAGMTAAAAALEGHRGWIQTYTGGRGRVESLTENLGRSYETRRIALKTHCMSHTVFPLIDAAYRLATQNNIRADDIEMVTVVGPSYMETELWRPNVISFEDAVCSAPFPIALNLLEPAEMTYPDKVMRYVGDGRMNALLKKFVFQADPSILVNAGPLPGTLIVAMKNGKVFREDASSEIKGVYPDHPLTQVELETKFIRSAEELFSSAQIDRFLVLANRFEHLPNVTELAHSLRLN